DDVHHCLCTRE
ncbi:putative DNA-binding domain protein, partial [Vibrio parahaemolyticus V-223/04]